MAMKHTALILGIGLALASAAQAETTVASEISVNGAHSVTLHLQPFLTDEELATLRLVATNDQALALFVPQSTGFAAMAASPEDGFIRDGAAVPSAVALAEFADAGSAATAALGACDAARKGKTACVLVLEIAPAK